MERELWKGNEALAEAAMRAGAEAFFGYPITPQTELLEYMARRMPNWAASSCKPRARSAPSTWSTARPAPGYAP